MPSTHLSLHAHIVFSTKKRRPFIAPEWRDRLHAYLGGAARHEGAVAKCVGGVADHVHILLELKATHSVADIVRGIKSASSAWVHTDLGVREFGWQDGYGAFTVSPRGRLAVINYIVNQERHHAQTTFPDEYVKLLEEAEVEYDPQYLW
jgi:REP element-mobilizing transposase RayT